MFVPPNTPLNFVNALSKCWTYNKSVHEFWNRKRSPQETCWWDKGSYVDYESVARRRNFIASSPKRWRCWAVFIGARFRLLKRSTLHGLLNTRRLRNGLETMGSWETRIRGQWEKHRNLLYKGIWDGCPLEQGTPVARYGLNKY